MLSYREINSSEIHPHEVEFTEISHEIFKRHQWNNSDSIGFNLSSITNFSKFALESLAIKKYHAIETYYQIIIDSLRGLEDQFISSTTSSSLFRSSSIPLPGSKQRILEDHHIIKRPLVKFCKGKFLNTGDLKVIFKGENLSQICLCSLEMQQQQQQQQQTQNENVSAPKSQNLIKSFIIHEINDSEIHCVFIIPKNLKIDSSHVMISLSNYFSIIRCPCVLPFNIVWLIGKSGAGKTQLRLAFESFSNIQNQNQTQNQNQIVQDELKPKIHVVPEDHEDYERSCERNQVQYYEYNGFTDFTEKDVHKFVTNLHDHPPKLILLLINMADTVKLFLSLY